MAVNIPQARMAHCITKGKRGKKRVEIMAPTALSKLFKLDKMDTAYCSKQGRQKSKKKESE